MNHMRHQVSTAIGKGIQSVARLRGGGGSALPGLVIEKIDPEFVSRALSTLPYGVVLVSGTNGKTTTTKVVVELLESAGLKVFTNRTGSNFSRGIASALLGEIKNLIQLEDVSRFPTFLLEAVLRQGEAAPYSLFFYPISFSKTTTAGFGGIPSAFLAGTFGGIERDLYPSVTERHNYHLLTVLDAIRPLVDEELGKVLSSDEALLAKEVALKIEEEDKRKLLEQRAHTADLVRTSAEELSRIFRQAQGQVARIEAAVDRVGRTAGHAFHERRIALQAAAAGFRIDAMKTRARELPAGPRENRTVDFQHRVGDADDLVEAVHQGLQLLNVDKLWIVGSIVWADLLHEYRP